MTRELHKVNGRAATPSEGDSLSPPGSQDDDATQLNTNEESHKGGEHADQDSTTAGLPNEGKGATKNFKSKGKGRAPK